MVGRWIRVFAWEPYEALCRRIPLIPFRARLSEPLPGVLKVEIGNFVTRTLGAIGGYPYSISYLVDGCVLVDTGFPWARRTLRKVLVQLDVARTLEAVLNTHYHEDHTGNNDVVGELTRARFFAHRDALAEIRFPTAKAWYRRFLFGPPVAVEVEPAPDRIRAGGRDYDVVHTPGHCPGHVCLFDPARRWLFSGDLYISDTLDSQLGDADGPAWIASLERALELQPEALLDGHGFVVTGRSAVAEVLASKLAFLRELQDAVTVAASRSKTVEQITREVFGRRTLTDRLSFSDGRLALLTGSDFSRANLVRTFLRELARNRPAVRPAAQNAR